MNTPSSPLWCVHLQRASFIAGVVVALLVLAACGTPAPAATPVPTATPALLPTIEVTRVVTQTVVVTATPAPRTACAPATVSAATAIHIGALAPLTQGGVWERGLAMQAGLAIAVEEINAAGGIQGRPLHIITYDTGGRPETAAAQAERLIIEDCVIGIIGGFNDDVSRQVKQVTEQYGVPFLVVEASADDLTADRPAALFRVAPAATMTAQMSAQWLAEVGDFNGDGSKSVVLIAENSPSGDVAVANVTQWLPTVGFEVEVLRVDVPSADYSPQIARIVAMEQAPDTIFLALGADAALTLQRQLLDAGIGPRKGTLLVTGRSGLDGGTFWQQIPDGEFTVIGRRGAWSPMLNEVGEAFVAAYQRFTPQWPDAAAFGAYDGVYLLADAAARAGSLAPAELVAAMETTDLPLAAGRYRFPYNSHNPPDGTEVPDYLWHQWTDPPLLYLQYRSPGEDPTQVAVIWPPEYRTSSGPVIRPD